MYNQKNIEDDFVHIPQEAFLFVPQRNKDPELTDHYKQVISKDKMYRQIYEGWAESTYTSYQHQGLQKFESYLKENKLTIDDRWDKAWRLRFLLSNEFNIQKTLQDMDRYIAFRLKAYEISSNSLNSKLQSMLNKGVIYICGRDSHYRPIIIFNSQKFINEFKDISDRQNQDLQIYLLDYIINEFLIPGQVENWIFLVDSGYLGLFSMADKMKVSFSFLADAYRSRLFRVYNVRISTSVLIIWGIVKNFLPDETVQKINLYDQELPTGLFEHCHPSQVQVKFGGTLPNIQQNDYWPPKERSSIYRLQKIEGSRLMTKEEYTEHYNNRTLYNTKFHSENILRPVSDKLIENLENQKIKKMEKFMKKNFYKVVEECYDYENEIEKPSGIEGSLNFSTLLEKVLASSKNSN